MTDTPSTNQILIRALLAIWSITFIVGVIMGEVWVIGGSITLAIIALISYTIFNPPPSIKSSTLPFSQMLIGATLIPGLAGLIFPYTIAFKQEHTYDTEPFFGPLEDWFFALMFLIFAAIPVTLLAISAISAIYSRQSKQKLSLPAIVIGFCIGVAFVGFFIAIFSIN